MIYYSDLLGTHNIEFTVTIPMTDDIPHNRKDQHTAQCLLMHNQSIEIDKHKDKLLIELKIHHPHLGIQKNTLGSIINSQEEENTKFHQHKGRGNCFHKGHSGSKFASLHYY